jgi:arylsulfatase A-like enzyme
MSILVASIRVLSILVVSILAACGAGNEPRPHVVLIVVDTLRADHLSQYGYERDTSRALERFSAQATRFTNAYAPSSWTTPSTASLLTGILPRKHGADFRGAALSPEALTLAEILRAAGWDTAGVSFNHNVTRVTGFDQGFRRFRDHEGESKDAPDIAEMLTTVSDWLPSAPDRPVFPVFLYLQPMNVHGPYRVPEARAAELLGEPPGGAFRYSKGLMDRIMKDGELQRRAEVDEAYRSSQRDQYDVAVRYTMDELGRLLERLRQRGLYDEALILVTADHGEELYDHLGFGHGFTLHREVLHVPLLVKMPGQQEARVVEEWTSLLDLLPTILEVAGVPAQSGGDGRSLLPLLSGAVPAARAGGFPLFETRWPSRFVGSALVAYPWKLIWIEGDYEGRTNQALLFDLAQDPLERQDLAAERPEVVQQLKRTLEERRAAAAAPLAAGFAEGMDETVLRALGY